MGTQQFNYSEIYNIYAAKVRRYLNSIFSIEDSEDLLQDIFIKVFNSLNTFRGEASLNTWIYRIASNTVIDRFKSNSFKFNKMKHELIPSSLHFNNGQYAITFEKQLEKDEMNDCIRQFITELTDKNRDIFILSQYEGLNNKEIAEILKISIDSVKIRLHRAKEALKLSLTKNCNVYLDDQSELSCEPISP